MLVTFPSGLISFGVLCYKSFLKLGTAYVPAHCQGSGGFSASSHKHLSLAAFARRKADALEQPTVNSDIAGRWIHFRTEGHSRRQRYLNSPGLATQLPSMEDLKIPLNYLKIVTRTIWNTQTRARLKTNLNLWNEMKPLHLEYLIQSMCWIHKCNVVVLQGIAQACYKVFMRKSFGDIFPLKNLCEYSTPSYYTLRRAWK